MVRTAALWIQRPVRLCSIGVAGMSAGSAIGTVWIVDDQPTARMAASALQAFGLRVLVAVGGVAAIEQLRGLNALLPKPYGLRELQDTLTQVLEP